MPSESEEMLTKTIMSPSEYFGLVRDGHKRFENVSQTLFRMILGETPEQQKANVIRTGNPISPYDYSFFRQGLKPIVGMHREIHQFMKFLNNAASGGTAKERAVVFVGEPANGKTFLVNYICSKYRDFLSTDENKKFIFQFKNLDTLKKFKYNETLSRITSQTSEDPMVLALNLFQNRDDSREFLTKMGFSKDDILKLEKNYRPLGADSDYIMSQLRQEKLSDYRDFKGIEQILDEHFDIVAVPISETLGTVTLKYPAGDKITTDGRELLGEEDPLRMLTLADANHPYRHDLQKGVLARAAGGGVIFCDEILKNKKDIGNILLGVIQERICAVKGRIWPLDIFIMGASNYEDYFNYRNDDSQRPFLSRWEFIDVSHCTNYKDQEKLVSYVLLDPEYNKTVDGKDMHYDPNLKYALSIGMVIPRMPERNELSPVEIMKLVAGDKIPHKDIGALITLMEDMYRSDDLNNRFIGQSGPHQRNLGSAVVELSGIYDSIEGECMFAGDAFKALERVMIEENLMDSQKKDLMLNRLQIAREHYRNHVKKELVGLLMEDDLVQQKVMKYINMITGNITGGYLDQPKVVNYTDGCTGEIKEMPFDNVFVNAVEDVLDMKSEPQKKSFREHITKAYNHQILINPGYDFMDNNPLVDAVKSVQFDAYLARLANREDHPENQELYDNLVAKMLENDYCKSCASRTLDFLNEIPIQRCD